VLCVVADKPKFLCDGVVYVKINEPNYHLVCKVHANPDVQDARITFTDPNDANNTIDTLEGGSESGDYKANVTVGVSIAKHYTTDHFIHKLEVRSVERGICPIAKSTMTKLFL